MQIPLVGTIFVFIKTAHETASYTQHKIMKINSNYKLREIAGETIIVNQGMAGTDMTRIISLNSSARFLYESLEEKTFSTDDVTDALLAKYSISKEQAAKDAQAWVDALVGCKVIEP